MEWWRALVEAGMVGWLAGLALLGLGVVLSSVTGHAFWLVLGVPAVLQLVADRVSIARENREALRRRIRGWRGR